MAMIVKKRGNPGLEMGDLVNQVAQRLLPIVRDTVVTAVRTGGGASGRRAQPQGRKARAGKRSSGKTSQSQYGPSNPSQNILSVGKSISLNNADSLRVVQKDIGALFNGATAGVGVSGITLGIATTLPNGSPSLLSQGLVSLGSVVPRLVNFAALYRQFTINSLEIRWIPSQGYTASGSVALGIDPSPLAGVPSGFNSVVHHTTSKLFDIKAEQAVVCKPTSLGKSGSRYTTAIAGLDEDELSYGVIQLYTNNGAATYASMGNYLVSVDVTFRGAM